MAELIKIDRNGSKHWRGERTCDRCGGKGVYAIGVMDDHLILSPLDEGMCWKCFGRGKVIETWIERTPEYQAKLDAKREAKRAKEQAARQAEIEKIEAERKARLEVERKAEAERLAKIEAEKVISQYVGEVGEKLTVSVQYIGSPYFERKCFGGYGTETCYINTFKDSNGNKIVWKTTKNVGVKVEEGQTVTITATVKEHSDYKGEKQTSVIRLKIA